MLFSRIVRTFQRKRSSLPAELAELQSVDQLRGVLDRERARADRSGVGFAVLKFVPRDPAMAQETLTLLAKILKRRLRSTDETGWLDAHQVAAVLPCTAAAGARRVADEVCEGFGESEAPHCEVFCYPSDSANHGNDRRNGSAGHTEAPVSALEPILVRPVSLAKRTLDIFGSIVALALFAPFMLVAAVAVKLTSRGPVFFQQLRAGRGNQPFWMYKFRTMRVGADRLKQQLLDQNELDGPAFKIKNDPRLTPIGRFLRRTSIDELPQLWNVLKGDMSLVGPAPPAVRRIGRLFRLAKRTAQCQAGPDVHLAGHRPVARQLRRMDADGPELRPEPIVRQGSEDPGGHGARGHVRRRRVLIAPIVRSLRAAITMFPPASTRFPRP